MMLYADLTVVKRIYFLLNAMSHPLVKRMAYYDENGRGTIPIQYNFTNAMKEIEFSVVTSVPVVSMSKREILLVVHKDFFGIFSSSIEQRIASLIESGYNVMYVTDQSYEAEDIKKDVKSDLNKILCGVAFDKEMFLDSKSFASSLGLCFMPKKL